MDVLSFVPEMFAIRRKLQPERIYPFVVAKHSAVASAVGACAYGVQQREIYMFRVALGLALPSQAGKWRNEPLAAPSQLRPLLPYLFSGNGTRARVYAYRHRHSVRSDGLPPTATASRLVCVHVLWSCCQWPWVRPNLHESHSNKSISDEWQGTSPSYPAARLRPVVTVADFSL
jgi:hypothetical protein